MLNALNATAVICHAHFRCFKGRRCIEQADFLCVLSALARQAERTIYEKSWQSEAEEVLLPPTKRERFKQCRSHTDNGRAISGVIQMYRQEKKARTKSRTVSLSQELFMEM